MILNRRFKLFLMGVLIGSVIASLFSVRSNRNTISFKKQREKPVYLNADPLERSRREAAWRVVKAYAKNRRPIASKFIANEVIQPLSAEGTTLRIFILQGKIAEQTLRVEEIIEGGLVKSFKVSSADRIKVQLEHRNNLKAFKVLLERWNYALVRVLEEQSSFVLLVALNEKDLKAPSRAFARLKKIPSVQVAWADVLEERELH